VQFLSTISADESTARATEAVIDAVRERSEPDVALLFITMHHRDDAGQILQRVQDELEPQALIGCTGEGVIGGEHEIEREPGMALMVGKMPGVRLRAFHVGGEAWRELFSDPRALLEHIGHSPETRAVIGLGDPFTTPVTQLMQLLDQLAPTSPLVGGMASGGRSAGQCALLMNDQVLEDGFVGLSISGPAEVTTIVSQGCKPIGRPMIVTRARDNFIEQLGGRPALDVVREMIEQLPPQDRALIRGGLLIGRAISEYRDTFRRGDFLIRNLMGVSDQDQALAIGDRVKVGQTVQFHVRDAATADEDLQLMLEPQRKGLSPAAGLLFSCNGRGRNLFDEPHHDIGAMKRVLPRTPVAGFFAAGELGPIAGKNFIHGHTASMALFRPRAL